MPNFDKIYLSQYLEMWKVIICKTTGLISIVWEHKYMSRKLYIMEEHAWSIQHSLDTSFFEAPFMYKTHNKKPRHGKQICQTTQCNAKPIHHKENMKMSRSHTTSSLTVRVSSITTDFPKQSNLITLSWSDDTTINI